VCECECVCVNVSVCVNVCVNLCVYVSVYLWICVFVWVCVCVCVCLCVYNIIFPACNVQAPYFHLYPVGLYNVFPHYLIKGTIFGRKLQNTFHGYSTVPSLPAL